MILRDAVIALGLKISGSVLWLAYSIVIARTLSQDDFGRLFYIINIVLLAGPVCGLGFENSVLRYGSRYWAAMQQGTFRALITQSRLYGLLGGAVLSLAIIVAFAAGFDNPLTHRATTVAGAVAAIGLYTVMCVHRDLLRSAGYLIRSQIGINITRAIVPLALSLALSALGWLSLDTALFSYVAALALSVLSEFYYFSQIATEAPPDRSENRKHLLVAMRIWPGDVFNALLSRADVLVLGALVNIEIAAVYIAAQRLALFVDFPLDAIRTSSGPALARAFADKQQSAYRAAVAEVSGVYAVGGLLGAAAVVTGGFPVLLLFGAHYTQGFGILLILVLGRLSSAILGPASIVMNLTDQEGAFSVVNGISVLMLLILVGAGAVAAGAVGAAVGAGISSWFSSIVLSVLIRRRHGMWIGLLNPEARAGLTPAHFRHAALTMFRRPAPADEARP